MHVYMKKKIGVCVCVYARACVCVRAPIGTWRYSPHCPLAILITNPVLHLQAFRALHSELGVVHRAALVVQSKPTVPLCFGAKRNRLHFRANQKISSTWTVTNI